MTDLSKLSYTQLLRAIPSPFVIIDEDLRIVAASPAFFRTFAPEADEYDLADAAQMPGLPPDVLETVFRNHISLEFKIKLPLPEIGERMLLVQASPLLVGEGETPLAAVLVTDLTEYHMVERHYRGLIESAPDAMVVVNGQGRIVLVNAQTQSMFDYAEHELIGKDIEILIPKRFHQAHQQHHRRYFADPRVRPMGAGMELFGMRKSGDEFPVEISLSPFRTEDGILISSAIRDISERRTVDELRTALERERKVNELKSRFTSMISHEFRTPMAGILASAELIQHYGGRMTEERRIEHLHMIQDRIQHLTLLLEDILTISKAQSVGLEFHPAVFELESFCHSIVNSLQVNGHEGRINLSMAAGIPHEIWADPKLLGHAANNLLSNALKYSPTRTTVGFAVSSDGAAVEFQVADEGIGIPEDEQQNLFQVFHRATNVGAIQGTGLGLAIVKEIADLHRGSVRAESAPGRTVFTLTIPIGDVDP